MQISLHLRFVHWQSAVHWYDKHFHILYVHMQVKLDDVDTELLLESVYKSLRRCKGPTEEFKRDGLSADQWNHLGREHTDLSVQRQTALKVSLKQLCRHQKCPQVWCWEAIHGIAQGCD